MNDLFGLERFVKAQNDGSTYEFALREMREGRKKSHWMWFVFPQIAGLGRSSTAQFYAVTNIDEARAYLAHPVLGDRLRQTSQALTELDQHDPVVVFGTVDALKLQSSMTLFAHASDEPVFRQVLAQYFDGKEDPDTVSRI